MGHALTKVQRQALADSLHARQLTLAAQLQAREKGRSPAEQALAAREEDGNDARQLASEHEVESALSGIEHRELAALSAALKRVHDADYGLCTACGRGIPFGRLQVEPQARRCVACEALHEKKDAA